MTILTRERSAAVFGPRRRTSAYGSRTYNWDVDFPLELKEKRPDGETTIVLEFQLTDVELEQFRESVGSRLSGALPLQIDIGRAGVRIRVRKRGPGAAVLSRKSALIAKFVTDRIDFQQIQAVRTAESAEEVVAEMVADELAHLAQDPEYQTALGKVAELQEPVLAKLSSSIHKTLRQFLPDVRGVRIAIPDDARFRALHRACEITVDDGTPTLLKHKGDGAQSLAALGIVRHASESGARGRHLVIAIEEPESHLHPDAIQKLKKVIDELSDRHQVLLTTHNPLFVDRNVLSNNVLVQNSRAKPARSIGEIRDTLGVRASDNLRHAELVLVVEGEDDRIAVRALMSHYSEQLRLALTENTLAVDTLTGSSNLAYKLGQLRASLCLSHALLDDDKAGREALSRAKREGLTRDSEVHFCRVRGLDEAEIEDLYNVPLYATHVLEKYGVSLDSPRFRSRRKWSDRVSDCFLHFGKQWNSGVEAEVKKAVARLVGCEPASALNPHHRGCFDALCSALEHRLDERARA